MNRRTALLLALAALLAHVLVIHHDAARNFAGPYDGAHAAYRMARNLAQDGSISWQGGMYEGQPQVLWVLILSLLERAGLPLLLVGQMLGLVATLLTVMMASRFALDRVAGIVSPALLVASGGVAAMAASGTDGPLFSLLGVATFVAFQYGNNGRFATYLALFVCARPEGLVLSLVFCGLSMWRRLHDRKLIEVWAFVPALLLGLALCLWPGPGEDSFYGPWLSQLFDFEAARWSAGLGYGIDFVLTTVTPLLLLFPAVELLLGRLSGVGRHALALGTVWLLLVMAQGDGPRVFCMAFVPALPIVYLAVQQGMILALDTERRLWIGASWAGLSIAVFLSALASKYPGNLGPFPLESLHRSWMRGDQAVPIGMRPVLGRMAAEEEIRVADEMRTLANFLAAHVEPGTRVLSPWPGALADLGGMTVDDLTGKVKDREVPCDVLGLFAREPAFVVAGRISPGLIANPSLDNRIAHSLGIFEVDPVARLTRAIHAVLPQYWILALPISSDPKRVRRPFYLLARRGLGIEPEVSLLRNNDFLAVTLPRPQDLRLPMVASLQVLLVDEAGIIHSVDPQGRLQPGNVFARTGLLLRPQESGPLNLWSGPLPDPPAGRWQEIRARLSSPGLIGDRPLYRIGEEAVLTE